MDRKNREKVKAGSRLVFVLAVLILGSCASVPRAVKEAEGAGDEFSLLDPGGLVYLSVNVPEARPILDLVSFGGVSGKQAAQMLDMTDNASAAVYPPDEGRDFLLAARGRFPSSRLRFSLGLSSSWKSARSETGGRYWRSGADNISIYVDAHNALISSGDPFPRTGGVAAPPRFGEIREGAALAGWVPDAAEAIDRLLSAFRIPLQIPADLLIFGVYPAPPDDAAYPPAARFFAGIRLELPSPSHVKALASMITLIRAFTAGSGLAEDGGLIPVLFANPPDQDDSSLILRTDVMDAEGIALLFNMFSIYSN